MGNNPPPRAAPKVRKTKKTAGEHQGGEGGGSSIPHNGAGRGPPALMPDQLLARLIAQSAADVGDAEEVENILEDEPSPTSQGWHVNLHQNAS